MRRAASLGALVAILPPPRHPVLGVLETLGFRGSAGEVSRAALTSRPNLLSAVWSASSMWAANAATVSAGPARRDGRTHLSIANLSSSLHRSLEPTSTFETFRQVFHDASFAVHPPLASKHSLRDEGAANHMRLCDATGRLGVDIFVYGGDDQDSDDQRSIGRQSLDASMAVARIHGLNLENTLFLRQHPAAIRAGAFHNDVVAASYQNVWLHHELAYVDADETIYAIEKRFREVTGDTLHRVLISEREHSLDDARKSYLFNSQLISLPNSNQMALLCPANVKEIATANKVLDTLSERCPLVVQVETVELSQSMNNGGGPACLRLRMPMTRVQWESISQSIKFTPGKADRLCELIDSTYPAVIEIGDLADESLLATSRRACDAMYAELLPIN